MGFAGLFPLPVYHLKAALSKSYGFRRWALLLNQYDDGNRAEMILETLRPPVTAICSRPQEIREGVGVRND